MLESPALNFENNFKIDPTKKEDFYHLKLFPLFRVFLFVQTLSFVLSSPYVLRASAKIFWKQKHVQTWFSHVLGRVGWFSYAYRRAGVVIGCEREKENILCFPSPELNVFIRTAHMYSAEQKIHSPSPLNEEREWLP